MLPFRRPSGRGTHPRRRWPRTGRRLTQALIWGAIALGAVALAPVVEEARSSRRVTEAGCAVLRVVDGDTVEIGCRDVAGAGDRAFPARIVGYDAPELFSPRCPAERQAALAAQAALSRLLREGGAMAGQSGGLRVALLGPDKYRRELVDLRVGGERVAARMVADGHGRRYLGGRRGG